ncbi:UBP-type zinc finger domain-containing protein [Streptacidiphilus sp. 4-A2]|nr:UBP-type zinc finger domain-containing protein [Streptacidiphilus sp. 4-A2]
MSFWQVTAVPGRSVQGTCGHLAEALDVSVPAVRQCWECVRAGSRWVHLRQCLTCGHVGCCDSSPGRHAHGHARAGHDLARSVEPGERWAWCYADELFLEPTGVLDGAEAVDGSQNAGDGSGLK